MSLAQQIADNYFNRTRDQADGQLDAAYQFQWTLLRDILARLEVILDDKGIPGQVAEDILRSLVYGAPSPAEAQLRMQQMQTIMDLAAQVPPRPFHPGG